MASYTATDAMNRIYRHQRLVYDVTRRYYLLGRERLITELDPGIGDDVLEIGCGTGRNLIMAARRYPDARFFGIDVSTEMLASATHSITRAGLSRRIRIAHADATAFDPGGLFGREKFDRIFVSYTLSMIPEWRAVLSGAITRLAPEGELHVVDFGRLEGLPDWFSAVLRRWLALFHVAPRDDLARALATCTLRKQATLQMRQLYRGYAQQAVVTLHDGPQLNRSARHSAR